MAQHKVQQAMLRFLGKGGERNVQGHTPFRGCPDVAFPAPQPLQNEGPKT